MLGWLNSVAVTVWGEQASWSELLGFATGLVCVWLVLRERIANWPVGIVNVALLMIAFWTAGLYADAGLQIVYVVLGLYGWWLWHSRGTVANGPPIRRTSRTEWWWLAVTGVAGTALLTWLLDTYAGSTVPFFDAVTTVLSLMATYGQCRKLLEQWWFWIVADAIYIPLYAHKGLALTTVLYTVFGALSVAGLMAWRRTLRDQTRHTAATAGAVT